MRHKLTAETVGRIPLTPEHVARARLAISQQFIDRKLQRPGYIDLGALIDEATERHDVNTGRISRHLAELAGRRYEVRVGLTEACAGLENLAERYAPDEPEDDAA